MTRGDDVWRIASERARHPGRFPGSAVGHARFPETQTSILAEAAAGEWDRFLQAYLAPCWREVVIACRTRSIPLDGADDLFQELCLRLMREGSSRQPGVSGTEAPASPPPGPANLPARYLLLRRRPLRSAQFRTVLKGVIRNLILEALRDRRRQPRQLDPASVSIESAVEDSIQDSVERQWLAECLLESAARLRVESESARTRGERRLFQILYRSTVLDEPPAAVAADLGVDRSTVADLLSRARKRFVRILQSVTKLDDLAELKDIVARAPELLLEALARAATGEPPADDP